MTGQHNSKDEIPKFITSRLKKSKPPSLAEAITGAAKTFAEAVKCTSTSGIDNGNINVCSTNVPVSFPNCVGISYISTLS